ncbi:U1 small nuclear ribonucleoprotein 70 kDa-like [Salvia splendens]|uniref:U1 small nuclear ribonucleoprotein 70 kDa-like n=1 Tax=Salvia splendens TaxID=180675 RepID=UPI001C272175|nr:U1 small nuclear ribonucleoprotein 70 kDa-like [Salvia splendens]
MSGTPNRRPHEDGGNGSSSNTGGSVNHGHPSVSKYPHDDQGTYSGTGGKVVVSSRHDYHAPYDMGQEGRMPKIAPRSNESRDAERRSPLLPNMLFRVPTPNDSHSDHVVSENRMEFRDSKDSTKESKVENRNMKPESRELPQTAKSDKYDSRGDDSKESKHERETYSEPKGNEKQDKDGYTGSSSQLNWKDAKEQHRLKQYPDVPGGNVETWQTSRGSLHGPVDTGKEGSHVDDKDFAEAREAVGENKVDTRVDDKFKEKDRKRKEVKHWDLGERDKERSDRRNTVQHANNSNENKDMGREERESERRGIEKKDPHKEKEKFNEKDNVKELWNGSVKEAPPHNEKELIEIPGKSSEQENSTLEPMKKDHDNWKNVEREAREKKKERDVDFESDRPDKRNRYNEKDLEDSMHVEGGSEREREVFNCGVQQRKRMLRPRGSPQLGNRDSRFRSGANDNEGSQGKTGVSYVVYKIGECMQELIKLWKEYESLQADKACDGAQNGPTLEICIPAEHVTATNRQVRGGQLWGTDVYTVDSDLVAVLMHTGYCRPTASPPPSATQELRATIRVLPPQDSYNSTLRNNVRSRAWGAAIGCSYRVERCCIVKKGGGIIDLEPCLTHSSTMEPTLAPVAVERTMTTRAAASNASRQQRFVREVTIQFNLCMEPWLKYSISAVADKGLKKSLFTSARLKKGEVLYVETHSRRYELCFNGEKVVKAATASHAHGSETGKPQTNSAHSINGERSGVDGESTVVDIFRWSRCRRPLPQKSMQSIGIPLPIEHVEVLEDNLEWDEIAWSQTGAWIGGKEYNLARAHFLSQR